MQVPKKQLPPEILNFHLYNCLQTVQRLPLLRNESRNKMDLLLEFLFNRRHTTEKKTEGGQKKHIILLLFVHFGPLAAFGLLQFCGHVPKERPPCTFAHFCPISH